MTEPFENQTLESYLASAMADPSLKELAHEERAATCLRTWQAKNVSKADIRTKTYNASDLQINEGSREVVAVINTDAIDQDGEVVLPKGMKKTQYQGNPVVFSNHKWAHDPNALPIGVAKWVKHGINPATGKEAIIAKAYITDKTQEGRDVFSLMQDGVLKGFSIGFNPIEQSSPTPSEIKSRPELKNVRNIVRSWELIEFSVVAMPCNTEALAVSVAKGKCSAKTAAFITGVALKAEEVTEQAIEAKPEKKIETKSKKEYNALLAERVSKAASAIDVDALIKEMAKRL